MAKKNINLSIYLIGMAVTLIGFCLPILAIGGNGFNYIGKNGFVTTGALLIVIGAIAGVVIALLGMGDQLEWIALAVSVVGGIVLFLGFNDNGISRFVGKLALKNTRAGFWTIIVGWVVAAIGKVLKK